MTKAHAADELVQSAHRMTPKADEYLIDAAPPTGALVKADYSTLVLEASGPKQVCPGAVRRGG